MGEIIKKTWKSNVWIQILTCIAVILIFTGVVLPPLGVIDNSILIAVGELASFGVLFEFAKAIDEGYETKIKMKEIEMSVNKNEKDDSDE